MRRYVVGDRVLMAEFGAGTVEDVDDRDPQRWIDVEWDNPTQGQLRHIQDPYNGKVVWEASEAMIETALDRFFKDLAEDVFDRIELKPG